MALDLPDQRVEYSVSPSGRLLSAMSAYGVTSYGYDSVGRPVTLDDSDVGLYGWTWRPDGLLDVLVRPSGLRTEYDWSPSQRLAGISSVTELGQLVQEDVL